MKKQNVNDNVMAVLDISASSWDSGLIVLDLFFLVKSEYDNCFKGTSDYPYTGLHVKGYYNAQLQQYGIEAGYNPSGSVNLADLREMEKTLSQIDKAIKRHEGNFGSAIYRNFGLYCAVVCHSVNVQNVAIETTNCTRWDRAQFRKFSANEIEYNVAREIEKLGKPE